mmetsp:Transcript_2608/g.2886  ORF Transcript_2608/g.2886 Transcript_2608/m.2886 type:complete len:401 (-) Transcript_2608:503-1705(-)|eukprot:CAMPEP_0197848858 /NCGR_PEP_ID=MMETSP1438-20131217/10258_1 /TAXON_ID=1461541 /ORGANISM="Pterosperma sp., Strain CCMP1384" /LENGTH=400 /DNA_ID=CAMNT_0043461289 /DNA_START=171 /DNA_END=1373 /DNA_ORIENTATION=+
MADSLGRVFLPVRQLTRTHVRVTNAVTNSAPASVRVANIVKQSKSSLEKPHPRPSASLNVLYAESSTGRSPKRVSQSSTCRQQEPSIRVSEAADTLTYFPDPETEESQYLKTLESGYGQLFRSYSSTQTEQSFVIFPLLSLCTDDSQLTRASTSDNVTMSTSNDRFETEDDPDRPSQQKDPDELSQDFFANVGDAIRTLRREIPRLFHQELTYSIYREDIVFRDPHNVFYGLDSYKRIFQTLRLLGNAFFRPATLRVDILRIWQPNDRTIIMRWTIRGLPRFFWQAGTFDGNSEFKLDSEGKIYEHKVDNIVMNTEFKPMLSFLNMSLASKTPTPSYFSAPKLSSSALGAKLSMKKDKKTELQSLLPNQIGSKLIPDQLTTQPNSVQQDASDMCNMTPSL